MKNKLELGSIIELECVEITYEGLGKCFYQDKPIFVLGLFVNEKALVKVTKILSKYCFGSIYKYLSTSHKREKIDLFYTISGSAPLYGLDYEEQLKLKTELINKFFNWKYPNLLDKKIEIEKSLNKTHYRNKSRFVVKKVNNKNCLFSYEFNTNNLIKVNDCPIVDNKNLFRKICDILTKLDSYEKLDVYEIIGRIYDKNNYSLRINVNNDRISISELKNIIDDENGLLKIEIRGIKNNLLFSNETNLAKPVISLHNRHFIVDINSFFQIDTQTFSKIIEDVNNYINLNNDHLIDLYCGVGTLGICLYNEKFSIYGIEIDKIAIETADQNLIINNIPSDKSKYFVGDAKNIKIENFDFSKTTLILDPPRSGIDKELINKILEWKPQQLIYISCDFKTQLRDLEFLLQDYKIEFYKGYDIFAQTMHFETVAILNLKNK